MADLGNVGFYPALSLTYGLAFTPSDLAAHKAVCAGQPRILYARADFSTEPAFSRRPRAAQITTRVDGVNEVLRVATLVNGEIMSIFTSTQPYSLRTFPIGQPVEFLVLGEGAKRSEVWGPYTLEDTGLRFTLQDTLADGTVGAEYDSSLTIAGAEPPLTWSVSGTLPTGLTFDQGQLSGTPSAAGTYKFTATVLDGRGAVRYADCTVVIAP